MIRKSVLLAALLVSLGGCLPYNSYYNQGPSAGYYPNSYSQAQSNLRYQQPTQQVQQMPSYQDDLSDIGYNANQTFEDMMPGAIPVQQTQERTVYQELPQNPMASQFATPKTPYYNPQATAMPAGVVGVGASLNANAMVPSRAQTPKNEQLKLIMPGSWRMAHPSIGKGLELANEAERFEFNRVLNTVSVKNPADVIIGANNVSIIALDNSGQANSRGFLCKDAYLVKANRDSVEKMWGKFCRHPNWNEWVLTAW